MSRDFGATRSDLAMDLGLLYATHLQREDWVRAEGNLVRQAKSVLRRIASADCTDAPHFRCTRCTRMANDWYAGKGDKAASAIALIGNYRAAIVPLHLARLDAELTMTTLAKRLHVSPFVVATRGFGYLGLAQIVAEAGDLSNYPNPGKLWARFGLQPPTARAKGETLGFSPRRRSIMFSIGDSLVKQGTEYRNIYLERKAYEQVTSPNLRPIQHHRRAQRYMEKRLLRELWKCWRSDPIVNA